MKLLWETLRNHLWYKLFLGVVLGILATQANIYGKCPENMLFISFFSNILGAFIIWSGSEYIYYRVGEIYTWDRPVKRSIMMVLWNMAFVPLALLFIFQSMTWITHLPKNINMYVNSLFSTLLITLVVNLIYMVNELYVYWRDSMYESEVLRKENLRAQLDTLKTQVNPHFLFNSLNTLISIIDEDKEMSKVYVQKLSQVYRYILQAREKDLTTLQEELEFVEAYMFLLKIRHGDNLNFEININSDHKSQMVPPLVLQMLVENAIKHNVVSSAKPLHVVIENRSNQLLEIRNNYQPKTIHVESNKVGLKNIADRYRILAQKEIDIIQNESYFIVKLPLL